MWERPPFHPGLSVSLVLETFPHSNFSLPQVSGPGPAPQSPRWRASDPAHVALVPAWL